MTVRLTLSVTGVQTLQARMTNRANLLGGPAIRAILQEAGKLAVETARTRVDRSTPGELVDLSPAYREQKRRQVGHAYPILERTGAMMASMYARVFQTKAAGWLVRVGFAGQHPAGLPNQRLAEIHIKGQGSAPVRDFLSLPAKWGAQWIDRIRAELKKDR